jgi:hypothetical protein
MDGPPVIEQLDIVGSYNLFETQREESAVRWWDEYAGASRADDQLRLPFADGAGTRGQPRRTAPARPSRKSVDG